ncbi:ABC transporter permease [Dactylosporangium sp. AC04546]|uniref:ABC transporter permease n=1 Tax=Dactylosporangium sp. AC04546 TaxID=2862460 RepID=UPI001EDD99FA|nr:ABC transporter permease [Dactylosporangium sp. AC04546]WVK89017.1 ABC transporter permease [Dactylosporangium sp. AC04546]
MTAPSTRAALLAPRVNLPGLITAAGLLAAWQALVSTGVITFVFLPGPLAIAGKLPTLLGSATFWQDYGHTLTYSLAGWGLGAAVGIVVGSVIGISKALRQWTTTSLTVLRLIPAIALLPIAALIFGLSADLELAVVTYVATWPVLVSTAGGIEKVDPLLRDVARTLRISRLRELTQVVVPSAIGPILVGLRLSLSSALVLAIVSEMIGNPAGLGNAINMARNALKPELTFCYIAVVGVTAVALNGIFNALSRVLAPGGGQR